MKHIFQINEPNKVLFKNFTSLSLLQISNYIFPLITLPYLVRVLGPEKYGLINFAAAFTGYFTIITDYGFNLSATQEISVNRNDQTRVTEIFSSVITLKMIFFIFSSLIFLLIVFFIPQFQGYQLLFIVTFISVFGTALFPLWFYQGIEKMNYILIITVSVRLIITVLIFMIIKTENDFIKLAALNTTAQFVIGLSGLLIVLNKFQLKYVFPKTSLLKLQIKNGWNLFLSTVWINLYTTSNVFILGLFAPANVVGYFAAADKIRSAFQGILSPMSQSVFPYASNLLNNSREKFEIFSRKFKKIYLGVGIIMSSVIFVFSEPISLLLLGNKYEPSIVVLRIISILPFLSSITSYNCIHFLIQLRLEREYLKVFILSALVNLSLSIILVPKFLQIGTSISFVIAEMSAALLSSYFVIKISKKN